MCSRFALAAAVIVGLLAAAVVAPTAAAASSGPPIADVLGVGGALKDLLDTAGGVLVGGVNWGAPALDVGRLAACLWA
jgi:hypothetical protein